jgi:AcrR family transcriptional regulator
MNRKTKSPKELSQERLGILLAVAANEFLDKGYSGCSIDHISRESGVSKSTIYRHFSGKEELFEAVHEQIADEHSALIGAFAMDTEKPAETLKKLARHIRSSCVIPRYLEFFRLLIAESGRLPEMTERLRSRGFSTALGDITTYFEELIAEGRMEHPDPRQAALMFYALARGNFRPFLEKDKDLDQELRRIDMDVDVFLRGCHIQP